VDKISLRDKTILLISPEAWGDNFVSKHHYAVTLARLGNQVYFLNPPSTKFCQLFKKDNLFLVDYKPKFTGLRFLPSWLAAILIKQEIRNLEKKLNVTFDIIWNFDPSRFFNLKLLNQKLRICHLVDLNQVFQRHQLANTADICFVTTDYILNTIKPYNKHVYKIHHAYAEPSLDRIIQEENHIFSDNNVRIKALYIGNLSMPYIDWEILEELVRENTGVDFYFIGPEGKSNLSGSNEPPKVLEKIKKLSNAKFTGSVKYDLIPAILERADIVLVSYQERYHIDQASPHKMMEYLGSGKVIVSTYTDEYKDKKELLVMAKHNDMVPAIFKRVCDNINFYNSPEKVKQRIYFALDNTYTKQLSRIEQLIENNLG
jgi:glycosyltransferase involved in cell wall biosynthesis